MTVPPQDLAALHPDYGRAKIYIGPLTACPSVLGAFRIYNLLKGRRLSLIICNEHIALKLEKAAIALGMLLQALTLFIAPQSQV
jgi:hypothetical protein